MARRASVLSAVREAALGEHGRVDAPRELLQFLRGRSGGIDGAVELRAELAELGGHRCLRGAQLQAERDQPLLGAVVHVALDPPTRLIRGGHDPGSGRSHLLAGLGVGDRGGQQLDEVGELTFDPGREFRGVG